MCRLTWDSVDESGCLAVDSTAFEDFGSESAITASVCRVDGGRELSSFWHVEDCGTGGA